MRTDVARCTARLRGGHAHRLRLSVDILTVSSIYRIGRHEGEQLQMEHIRRMELYRGINKDSINIKNQVDYGEPKKSGTATGERCNA